MKIEEFLNNNIKRLNKKQIIDEDFDTVRYNVVGVYLVRVGIEDSDGNKRYQEIVVNVIIGSC